MWLYSLLSADFHHYPYPPSPPHPSDDGKVEDSVSNEFWDLFGGFAPIAKKGATEDDLVAKAIPPTLYW